MPHQVNDIKNTPRCGDVDERLWQIAQREHVLLISIDKGFADLWDTEHHGVLIVRLHKPNGERIHRRVMLALASIPEPE